MTLDDITRSSIDLNVDQCVLLKRMLANRRLATTLLDHMNTTPDEAQSRSCVLPACMKPHVELTHNKDKYTFKAPTELCIDYFKVAQDLTPSKPLAIVEYDGVYHFIVHKDIIMKGKALNMNLIFEATDDPSEISNVVRLVRNVTKSPWPNRVRNQTVNVTIIKA